MTMKRSFLAALLFALLTLPGGARAASQPQRPVVAAPKSLDVSVERRLDEHFYRFETYELDLSALARRARQEKRVALELGGRVLELELEPLSLRARDYKRVVQTDIGAVELPVGPVATYRGRLVDDPRSDVRLVITAGLFQGFIQTADELLFIDPLTKYAQEEPTSDVVVFDNADVRPRADLTCGIGEIAHQADQLSEELGLAAADAGSIADKALLPSATLREVDVATDADYDYYVRYGNSAFDRIEGILNVVDWYYRRDLSMTLQLRYQNLWTSTAAPYPYAAINGEALLDAFSAYWNGNVFTSRDVAHLFSGKGGGAYAGLAYVPGAICANPGRAYSVTWDIYSDQTVAHEIGHNLNAGHDPDSNCPNGQAGNIMCAYVGGSGNKRFSAQSKSQIASYVSSSGYCLASISLKQLFPALTPTDVVDTGGEMYWGATQFSSSASGYIVALRYWKAPGESTLNHNGVLWTDTGVRLATVTFENETASGWQEQYLDTPVFITAGTRYRVTGIARTKQAKTPCGLQTPITNGTLTAWQGFYKAYSAPGGDFPNIASCSNFFADVYFQASGRRRAVHH